MDSNERTSAPETESQVGAVGGGGEPDEKNKKGKTLADVLSIFFPIGRLIPLDGIQFRVSEIDGDECEVLLKGTGFTKAMRKKGVNWVLPTGAKDDPELTREELLKMFGDVYDRYAQAFGMMSESFVTQAVQMLQNNTTASIAAVVEQMERKLNDGVVEILDLAGTTVKVYRGDAEATRREIDDLSGNVNLLRDQVRVLAEFLQGQFAHVQLAERPSPGQAISPAEIEEREIKALKAALPRAWGDEATIRQLAPTLADKILARDPQTLMRLMDPQKYTTGPVSNDLIPKSLVPPPLIRKEHSGLFTLYWPGSQSEMSGFASLDMAQDFWPGAEPDDELLEIIGLDLRKARRVVVEALHDSIADRNARRDVSITLDDIERAVFGTEEDMRNERRREIVAFIGAEVVARAYEAFEAERAEASQVSASGDDRDAAGRPRTKGGAPEWCNHGESYCLMKYASQDGRYVEWLWNSRDGVTPMFILSKDGQAEMSHVDWQSDRFEPNYQPLQGTRIFIDLTEEKALEYARAKVEEFWEHPTYPLKDGYESKDAAIEAFAREFLSQPGTPDIITVSHEQEIEFRQREWLSESALKAMAEERQKFYERAYAERDDAQAPVVESVGDRVSLVGEILDYLKLTEYFSDSSALELANTVAMILTRDIKEWGIPQPPIEQAIRETGAMISDELRRRLAINLIGRFQGAVNAMHGSRPGDQTAGDRVRAAMGRGDLNNSELVSSGRVDMVNDSSISLVAGEPGDHYVGHPESEPVEIENKDGREQ